MKEKMLEAAVDNKRELMNRIIRGGITPRRKIEEHVEGHVDWILRTAKTEGLEPFTYLNRYFIGLNRSYLSCPYEDDTESI